MWFSVMWSVTRGMARCAMAAEMRDAPGPMSDALKSSVSRCELAASSSAMRVTCGTHERGFST